MPMIRLVVLLHPHSQPLSRYCIAPFYLTTKLYSGLEVSEAAYVSWNAITDWGRGGPWWAIIIYDKVLLALDLLLTCGLIILPVLERQTSWSYSKMLLRIMSLEVTRALEIDRARNLQFRLWWRLVDASWGTVLWRVRLARIQKLTFNIENEWFSPKIIPMAESRSTITLPPPIRHSRV